MISPGHNLNSCPTDVRDQVHRFIERTTSLFGSNLRGIYLHGSLAQGSFQPQRSDIDLLLVGHGQLSPEEKIALARIVLAESLHPRPLELSLVHTQQIAPWTYPPPYDFHFSEDWRDRISHDLSEGTWDAWAGGDGDADLAAHVTVTHARGVVLFGEPIDAVFPHVPAEHFAAAILEDFQWIVEQGADSILYATLNACRIAAFFEEGLLLSKLEGAEWAAENFPKAIGSTAAIAHGAYLGRSEPILDAKSGMALIRHAASRVRAARSPGDRPGD